MWLAAGGFPAQARTDPTSTPVPAPVVYAGVRSSSYGIEPFPSAAGWATAMTAMSGYYPGSTPAAIWIVGTVNFDTTGVDLEFPAPEAAGDSDPLIQFADEDRHEDYLSYFDTHGIDVFLQVEPGFADVPTQIDLVLDRYGQHPCVIGFGIDVEWYQNATDGGDTMGVPVDDATAEAWEQRVKAHHPDYRLFLKHWDSAMMPEAYRGDLVFVDDSQMFDSLESFLDEMQVWSETFDPNLVMFQIGYPDDQVWWGTLDNPAQEIGAALDRVTAQPLGVIWVDFTLAEVLPLAE